MTYKEVAPRRDLEADENYEVYEDFSSIGRIVEETSPVSAIDEEGITNGE